VKHILLALLLAGCSGCNSTPVPVTPEPAPTPTAPVPPPVADAGPAADAARGDACSKACAHLRALGCPDGQPTAAGSSCETVCRSDRSKLEARLTAAYLGCLASVKACADEVLCRR
jgi:hypothetical protein